MDERKALTTFLAMVAKRRKRRPNMHIYHYAPYEKTALLRLAGRYGVGEGRGRRFSAAARLVDLYPLGAQEHSGRRGVVQPEGAGTALYGRAAARR